MAEIPPAPEPPAGTIQWILYTVITGISGAGAWLFKKRHDEKQNQPQLPQMPTTKDAVEKLEANLIPQVVSLSDSFEKVTTAIQQSTLTTRELSLAIAEVQNAQQKLQDNQQKILERLAVVLALYNKKEP